MNTTPQFDSNLAVDTDSIQPAVISRTAVRGSEYQHSVNGTNNSNITRKKGLAQLTTFRALGRQVFGAKAGYEYLAEAILFGWIMVVAAWPLTVTLNQLGTMYISPPNALW